jgi:hypothetical protein
MGKDDCSSKLEECWLDANDIRVGMIGDAAKCLGDVDAMYFEIKSWAVFIGIDSLDINNNESIGSIRGTIVCGGVGMDRMMPCEQSMHDGGSTFNVIGDISSCGRDVFQHRTSREANLSYSADRKRANRVMCKCRC